MVGVVLGSRTLRPWRLGVLMTRGGAAHGPATYGSYRNGFYQSLSKGAWSFCFGCQSLWAAKESLVDDIGVT